MGKRKPELSKLTNKELNESALKQIQELGFTVYDVKMGNCYFLFEDEDDSICHFRIKEIPGFLFAFWNICRFDPIEKQVEKYGYGDTWADSMHINPKSELVFFTQYEKEIDKFKPSRSGFVCGLYRHAWYESENDTPDKMIHKEEWWMYELEDILSFMKKHPIKAYVYACAEIRNIWDEVSGLKALHIYLKESNYRIRSKIRKWFKLKYQIFLSLKLVKKLKSMNVILFDRGESWSPRLQISLRRKKPIILETYQNDEWKVNKFEEKHWNQISIDYWDVEINKDSTQEDLEKDKELEQKFFNMVEHIKNKDNEDDYKILYMEVDDNNE